MINKWFMIELCLFLGVYDVISNLGSLPARMIFLPVEDALYLFFTKTLHRGLPAGQQQEVSFYLWIGPTGVVVSVSASYVSFTTLGPTVASWLFYTSISLLCLYPVRDLSYRMGRHMSSVLASAVAVSKWVNLLNESASSLCIKFSLVSWVSK